MMAETQRRCQNKQLKYKVQNKQNGLEILFMDRFSIKYFGQIKIKSLLSEDICDKYTIQQEKDKVIITIKKQKSQQKIANQELISSIQQFLKIDYYYLKVCKNQSQQNQIKRNTKIKQICQKKIFKKLYPQIKLFLYFNNNSDNFQKDQILIYIQSSKKSIVRKIIKYIESFVKQRVVFGLDQYFNAKSVQFSFEQFYSIIDKFIRHLKPQLQKSAKQAQLIIEDMRPYVPFSRKQKYRNSDHKFGIELQIHGMFQSLPQFYFNLSDIFQRYPIVLERIQDIQFIGSVEQTQQKLQKQQNLTVLFGSVEAVAVIYQHTNSRPSTHQLKKLLRKGMFIISALNGFTQQQITTLIKQHRQLDRYMNGQRFNTFIQYQYEPIDQKSFYIRCQKAIVEKFVKRCFDYFDQNKKVQKVRNQFRTEFQVYVFMKFIAPRIQAKYPTVSFVFKDNNLYSSSKQSDLSDLNTQIQYQKVKILKRLVKIPTLRKMKNLPCYQIKQDQLFCKQNTIRTIWYKFNQKTNVFLKSIDSIRSSQHTMITIIDKRYHNCQFFMNTFQVNQFSNVQKFDKLATFDLKQPRRIQYITKRSKYVSLMHVWYVEQISRNGDLNYRRLKRDIKQFVEQLVLNNQKNPVNFVIPQHFQNQRFKLFFSELFKELMMNQQCNMKQINLYYETLNFQKIVDDSNECFLRQNKEIFKLESKLYLSLAQLEKIIMLEYYSVNFWNQKQKVNQSLSVLNSFIFNYQKSKKKTEFKVPLFLKPIHLVQHEYLLFFKEEIYFKVDKYCKIQKHAIKKNQYLLQFSEIIKYYFNNSQYMVVYMNKEQTQVQKTCLYFWTKTNSQSQPQKIKRFQINELKKIIPKKDSQVAINVKRSDYLQKFVIQTHQDFANQVKKSIYKQE